MSKGIGYFCLVVTFIVGMSVGLYAGVGKNDETHFEDKEVKSIDSVQDVVIKKVQSEYQNSGDQIDTQTEEVVSVKEKVSPYAKLIINKKFTRCGHNASNIIDIPKEIINLTKEELEEKYSGWEIRHFSSDQVILYREIDANCEDHFVLKEKDGELAVYNDITDDMMNLVEVININLELLSEEDRMNLENGIRIYGREELSSIIEDYNS